MSARMTQRCHRLADSLGELKIKVRTALATELAGAVGIAVRDVLVAALLERILLPMRPTVRPATPSRPDRWDDEACDRWGGPTDPWIDPDEYEHHARTPTWYEQAERDEVAPPPAVPVAVAIAVGVNVGRWWLARQGTIATSVGFGVLATALGLAGGPFARAILAVLAAATDVLTAEAALARIDPS